MKLVYKKLLNISYNNKIFCIFLSNQKNRCTFLEVATDGKYIYPTLEDFIQLNEIYNNYNPFIVYTINYMFQEKVMRTSLGILTAITVINFSGTNLGHYSVRKSENSIQLIEENINLELEQVEIKDVSQLDEILGYKKIPIDEVYLSIDNNDKIPPLYKKIIHKFLDQLIIEYPSIDLRIFYENIKTIEIVIVDKNYFKEQGSKNIGGMYNANSNQIVIPENITEEHFYHELSHVLDLYYRETEDKTIYRGPTSEGIALNEAMTNVVTSCITTTTTYDKYGAVLEYLGSYVDFNYEIYNQKGIWYLIQLLKEKYPTVDINYIVLALDTMKKTEENGSYIYLDQSPELINELFEICKIELSQTTENYYEPFIKFTKLLYYTRDRENNNPILMYDYLEKYNTILENRNCNIEIITKEDIIEKCSQYEKVNGIEYRPGIVSPMISDQAPKLMLPQRIGSDENINYDYNIKNDTYLSYYIKLTCIENYEILGTNEYWEKIAFERQLIDVDKYKKIPIFWNDVLLVEECLDYLDIKIGYTLDGTIGFEIQNKKSETIYTSAEELTHMSNAISLGNYLLNNENLDALELSTVLNHAYLEQLVKEENLFYNILFKDEELCILPSYQLVVIIGEKASAPLDLGKFYFILENGKMELCPFHVANEISEKTYLKDILAYYGILNENQLEYTFSREELFELYQNYINDISLSRSNIR